MAYKVFISHSTRDQGLVAALANLLTRYGIEVLVAEWYLQPGQPIDRKVFRQIAGADCVIALLTPNGRRSSWVQQEIGRALDSAKLLIPLVEEGTSEADLGALKHVERIEYDPANPQPALVKAAAYVNSQHLSKQQRQKALLVTGGILAFLLLLAGESE